MKIVHFSSHHSEEFRKIDSTVAIGVHLVDHILKFGFSRVLAERAHNSAEFFGCDGDIAVLVVPGKGFFEFSDLFI